MNIGKLIKMQMVSKGIETQQELSDLSGVSVQIISRLLSNNDGKLTVAEQVVTSLGGTLKAEFKADE